jgi:hypothetical protein
MLATAYDAVHANDPNGRVVLGGIMSPADTGWLQQVFATPGFDAAHKFDVANVHLRDTLANMTAQLAGWKAFFAAAGDGSLPLWVSETGYPSDPAYQNDPAYHGSDAASGLDAQAAYLAQALPALVAGGAARVFVTERDNLGGEYASEGLIGGAVTDADENAPRPVAKPALSVFSALAAGQTPTPVSTTGPAPPTAAADVASAPVAVAASTTLATATATSTSAFTVQPAIRTASNPVTAKKRSAVVKRRRRAARPAHGRPARILRHGRLTQRQRSVRGRPSR